MGWTPSGQQVARRIPPVRRHPGSARRHRFWHGDRARVHGRAGTAGCCRPARPHLSVLTEQDNDGDAKIDCLDPDCAYMPRCNHNHPLGEPGVDCANVALMVQTGVTCADANTDDPGFCESECREQLQVLLHSCVVAYLEVTLLCCAAYPANCGSVPWRLAAAHNGSVWRRN